MELYEQLARALSHLSLLEHERAEWAADIETLLQGMLTPGDPVERERMVVKELRRWLEKLGRI